MHNFNIGDTVYAMSRPGVTGFFMGSFNNIDGNTTPLAVCVAYPEGEYYVGLNSVFETSSAAHAASTAAIEAIADTESEMATPRHLVEVTMKKAPRKKKATTRLAA